MHHDNDKLRILPQYFDVPRGDGWGQLSKPVLVLDGQTQAWKPNVTYGADCAFIVGTNDKNFESVCQSLTANVAYFYEMRVTDISALNEISGVRKIVINWNSKLSDLKPLGNLHYLHALALVDTPKATDLSFLASLRGLRAFEFSGSPTLSSKNTAMTLEPIGTLSQLEELCLHTLVVQSGGLRPLAKCTNLKRLLISNTFETEDYAYLAAKLPNTFCTHFHAAIPVNGDMIGEGIDTMVVGKRKPFLNSRRDAQRLEHFHIKFAELKAQFSEN